MGSLLAKPQIIVYALINGERISISAHVGPISVEALCEYVGGTQLLHMDNKEILPKTLITGPCQLMRLNTDSSSNIHCKYCHGVFKTAESARNHYWFCLPYHKIS